MENDFWLNLASKDLKMAKQFYQAIGFTINEAHPNPNMLSIFVGSKQMVVNFFTESLLRGYSDHPVADPKQSSEILFSLGAKSRQEVDDLAAKVVSAGGSIYAKPGDKDGWMYGCGFTDPDGHRWSVLYMDLSKMPKV